MDSNKRQQLKCSNIQTSISSVIGNATSFYMSWIKSKFPATFFKDTYVSGSLVSVETQRKDIFRKDKPLLLVKPEYAAENGFMEELPYWHSTLQYIFKHPDKYYTPVFDDPDHNIRIHAIPDRIKINFPTRIVVPTRVYGFNLLHYMKNVIEPGGHGFINNVYFENEIPSVFMHLIFDEIFNKDIKERNTEKERIIANKEDLLYNKEVKIITNLKKIKKLDDNNIEDKIEINKLNKENSLLDRETKKMKKDIDKLRNELEPIRFLDDSNEEKRIKNRQDLEDYINKFSNHTIVCRRNASSGNYEYAFKNRSNILMHMDSIPTMDPVKVGRAEDYAAISFEVSFDFNTNSNFLLESNYNDINLTEESLKDKNKYHFNLWYDEDIPDFILDDEIYFNLRRRRKFICELNEGVEVLPIEDLLDDATKVMYQRLEAIRCQLTKKDAENVDKIMKIHYKDAFRTKVFLNGDIYKLEEDPDKSEDLDNHFHWKKRELIEDKDYTVDWEKLEVHIQGPIQDAAYLFGLYVNYEKVNKIIKEIQDYNDKKLYPHNNSKFIIRSPKGIRYEIVINEDGEIKTRFFILSSVTDLPKWHVVSEDGTTFEITVEDDGTLGTKITDISEPNIIKTNHYELTCDKKGTIKSNPIF